MHVLQVAPVDVVGSTQGSDALADVVGITANVLIFGHDPEVGNLLL